jgi:hypothetical protein
MVIGTATEKRQRRIDARIARRQRSHLSHDLELGSCRQQIEGGKTDRGGNVGEHVGEARHADRREHVTRLLLGVRHIGHEEFRGGRNQSNALASHWRS